MAADTRKVKLVCSFGGCFHRRSDGAAFLYTSGINHVVSILRSSSLADLYIKVSAFFPPPFVLRYQLPGGDLDSLVSLSVPEDLDNMMHELDRLCDLSPLRPARIRLFVSPVIFDAVSGSPCFLRFSGDPDARDDNSPSETENSPLSSRIGHPGAQFLNPNASAVGVRGNVGFSPVETPKKINREVQVLNPTDSVFGFHQGMQVFSNNVSAVQIENPKTNQEEIPLRNNQKCTAGEENSLSEVFETSSPSKDSSVSVNGFNDADRGGVMIPTASCYLDSSRLGFTGENSTLETKQTLATSVQFSNPGDYVASGNLNQSFPAKIPCGCSSKTNQEDNSLSGESTTLTPAGTDHPGVQVSNPNGNAVGIHHGHVRNDLMNSEESAYRSDNNILYANDGDGCHQFHHQPLNQLPPLQPSCIMPPPLSYVRPQRPRPHPTLRQDNCERALRHSHSDPLSNGYGIGNVAGSSTFHETASTLLSHNSEDPMRLQAAHRALSGMEAIIETYPCENPKAACSNLEVSDHAKVLHQPGSSRVLEESLSLQSSQRDTTGGFVDIVTEPNVEITNVSTQIASCENVQKPPDNECLVHTKVQASDSHSSVLAPPSTIGLSKDTQLCSGVLANHVMPLKSLHEGHLQQLPLTSSQQFGFNGSSVTNVNVQYAQAPNQVSVPEVSSESVRHTNGMMEGLRVSSLEVRRLYDQQRQPVSVNVGSLRNVKSGNLPVVENDLILRSKFGDNAVFRGNAFVNQVMVPEGNSIRQNNPPSSINVKPGQHQGPACNNQSVRPQLDVYALYLGNTFIGYGIVSKADPVRLINHMPPLATNYICLRNVQPSETFQVSSPQEGPPSFYTQQMMVEPEVPSDRFFGMPKHLVGIDPVYDKDFNGNTIYKLLSVGDSNNMPGLPSGNFPTQHPISTCPTMHAEQFQGPTSSVSLFSNQASHQIPGSLQMVPPKPNEVPSKDFDFPLDVGFENCQICSKALPTVENCSFHQPHTSMDKDPGLEPVQLLQGNLNDISGPPSSNIPTQHTASRCPIDYTELFQGPTPLSSLFSNQDPQQTLGGPSKPNNVPGKEIAAPMDLGSQNCRIYSTVLPTVENDIFHQPQAPRNKDSGLEPVMSPQVKLDNVHGLPSSNIPTHYPTSRCPIEHTEQFQAPAPSSSRFTNQNPHQILGSTQMTPSIPNEVSGKDFTVPVDMGCENCQIYDKVLPTVENGFFHQLQTSMNKEDSVLEPVPFPQGEEHNKQESLAAGEQVVASLLQASVPTLVPISCERRESDPQPNNESGLVDGNTSLHNAVSLGEHKIEDIKTKQSEKMNLGIPVTDNVVHLQIIKNSDLEELQELGSGAFGTMYHGKWKGSDVVIKRINNRFFAGKPSEEQRMREDFWNEACKLAELHHPNVVAFYGVVLDGPEGSYATVTEIMVSGSVRLALQRNNRSLDRRNQLLIAMDVAFGMEYLHDKNIVHSNLKSDNLLVNLKDPQRPVCKVSDLGLLKVKRQTVMSGGVRGTLPWMAPELLSPNGCLVSKKVDVYSFGIVMWELLTGEEPYADMHCGAIIGGIVNNMLRPPVPESCDPDWKSLMEQCWSSDPSERPSFTEIATRLRSMAD